jgi:hypothetical protein
LTYGAVDRASAYSRLNNHKTPCLVANSVTGTVEEAKSTGWKGAALKARPNVAGGRSYCIRAHRDRVPTTSTQAYMW